ncbi:MAG: hypothetical protein U5R06_04130 [candidate division KSB1 bacterium]|nr:hypothetical protein [candidate division KSB1 bacterium]
MLCKVGKTVRVSCVAILIIVALVGMSCSLNEVDDPLSSGSFRITKAARTTNQNGVGRRTFYRHETLIVNLMDLIKQEQTFIEIVRLSDDRTLNETVMVTDMDGNIMGLPVWHHIGLGNDGNPMSAGATIWCMFFSRKNMNRVPSSASRSRLKTPRRPNRIPGSAIIPVAISLDRLSLEKPFT